MFSCPVVASLLVFMGQLPAACFGAEGSVTAVRETKQSNRREWQDIAAMIDRLVGGRKTGHFYFAATGKPGAGGYWVRVIPFGGSHLCLSGGPRRGTSAGEWRRGAAGQMLS